MQSIFQKDSSLPPLSAEALAHSEKLLALIKKEIAEQGPMTFARYMELALYAPGLGYYSAGTQKFGTAGDFVTAPEISPLFSRCIAKQCHQVLAFLGEGDILELGAGSGIMAADILTELEKLNALPRHYFILEVSADLKQRQQHLLQQKIPHLLSHIIWLDSLENFKLQGIILANEVIDAMPVHKFKIENGIQEFYVNYTDEQLNWQLAAPQKNLVTALQNLNIKFSQGYESEINLLAPAWMKLLSDTLSHGLILCIDYGFLRHEYYHPQRSMGTLMCHFQHRAHTNPLILTGLQDITAHVDFTAVSTAAEDARLEIIGYTTQANFLLNCGITALVQTADPIEQFTISQQLKKLLLPSEMGELFKVIALAREVNIPLLGFN